MSTIVTIALPRIQHVQAIRFIPGVTSKTDLLAVCPGANVGVPVDEERNPIDDRDIRWITVPDGTTMASGAQPMTAGDWLVRIPGGQGAAADSFEVLSHERFGERYEVTGRAEIV